MPRVVFVNRYFHPDHSATSQIASDLAFHLAANGWDVGVVTSRQRYDDARAHLDGGTIRGVLVRRVWSTRFGRSGLAGRAVDYLTFYLSAFAALLRERRATVVALTDPPLISVVAALASPRLVNWVQDLFPEVATALGIRTPRLLLRLRDWSFRRAKRNVVLGGLMAARVPNAVVIHNWADRDLEPVGHDHNDLRREWGLDGSFVVGYSGNLGRAHDVDTIVSAIRVLNEAPPPAGPPIRFLFIGGGAKLDAVRRDSGPDVTFVPYQPREVLSRSLSAADVHLVSLEPALEGLIVPSKFYGALAVARPVIFIGSPDGEIARLVREGGCGTVVPSGDTGGLVRAIRSLAGDPGVAADMGRRGLEMHRSRFDRGRALEAWERVLGEAP